MKKSKQSLLRNERGLTTVEYIIVLGLIAVVGFGIWKKFGATVAAKADSANTVVSGLPDATGED